MHLLAVIGDYAGVPELELTFGPTTNEHKIALFIIDDPALEHTESFQAVMSGEQSVTFLHHQATVWILDNDGRSCTLPVTITALNLSPTLIFLHPEVSIGFTQSSFTTNEGEPVIFLTLSREGLSYIEIPLNLTSHSATATGQL